MILPLFEREIGNDEIQGFARELGLEQIPVLHNPMEEDAEDALPAFDVSVLETVLRMLDHARLRMHIAYELQDVMVPLISMYIFRKHMLCAIYNRRGTRLAELMAVEDVKILLLQTFEAFALKGCGGDETILSGLELDDMMNKLIENELAEEAQDDAQRAGLQELQEVFASAPRLCCVFDDADHAPMAWYAVKARDKVYNLLETDGGARIIAGSCLPMIDGACKRFISRFRAGLKTEE